jgi:hypothetical protein
MILPAMARRGFRGKRVEAKRAGMMAIASKELPVYTMASERGEPPRHQEHQVTPRKTKLQNLVSLGG